MPKSITARGTLGKLLKIAQKAPNQSHRNRVVLSRTSRPPGVSHPGHNYSWQTQAEREVCNSSIEWK